MQCYSRHKLEHCHQGGNLTAHQRQSLIVEPGQQHTHTINNRKRFRCRSAYGALPHTHDHLQSHLTTDPTSCSLHARMQPQKAAARLPARASAASSRHPIVSGGPINSRPLASPLRRPWHHHRGLHALSPGNQHAETEGEFDERLPSHAR